MYKQLILKIYYITTICCIISCNSRNNIIYNQAKFENYRSIKDLVEGKSFDPNFTLPKDDSSFGKKLYTEKTICFTDVSSSKFGARTCTAEIYENGISIEVDGHKSYFDAAGMDMIPKNREFTITAMPSETPGVPWQPAIIVIEDVTDFWIYTSLYNKGNFHQMTQRIEGWYWEYAKRQGYKYKVLILN